MPLIARRCWADEFRMRQLSAIFRQRTCRAPLIARYWEMILMLPTPSFQYIFFGLILSHLYFWMYWI
jgi:hypothetical protein